MIVLAHGNGIWEQVDDYDKGQCGAVVATCVNKGEVNEGSITNIVNEIAPTAKNNEYKIIETTVHNTFDTIENMRQNSDIINKLVKSGELTILPMYHNHKTLLVEVLHQEDW